MSYNRDNQIQPATINIKVFGIGGGGNNVLRKLARNTDLDIELIALNTDIKQLQLTAADGVQVLPIGINLTNGYGTGGKVELGQMAAQQEEDSIRSALQGADMIIVTAGMGGGVGTGAAPIVAGIAKEMGILSLGIVTEPFSFEGKKKINTAKLGIQAMQAQMDGLVVVQNDKLKDIPEYQSLTLRNAFAFADEALNQSIKLIIEMVKTTGIINVDFADVTTIFHQGESSDAILGIGEAETALEAVQQAMVNPLVDRPIAGARGVILNLTASDKLPMFDVSDAANFLYENTHPDVNTILGIVEDQEMKGRVRATLVATDFVDGAIFDTPNGDPGKNNSSKDSFNGNVKSNGIELPTFMGNMPTFHRS